MKEVEKQGVGVFYIGLAMRESELAGCLRFKVRSLVTAKIWCMVTRTKT
jgi:hypothetical protein